MPYLYKYIDSATTTTITASQGVLHSIVVNTAAAGTITVSDANGTIALLKASVVEGTYLYDVSFNGYLAIVTGSADSNVTVTYNVT